MSALEYRIGWATNRQGSSDDTGWMTWDGEAETVEAAEAELIPLCHPLPPGLDQAIEFSGFGWWVEVRESAGSTGSGPE